MLSRVADAVYWMTRYFERAENVARFVDVSLHLSLDIVAHEGQWAALVATTGDDDLFRERYGDADRDKVLDFLTFDPTYSSSIYSSLRQARENARGVREVISSEMWQILNTTYHMVSDAARSRTTMDAPHAFFSAVKEQSAAFIGTTYVTMTHNEAWHFGRLGRLLERADKTSRILDVKSFLVDAPSDVRAVSDEAQSAALLKSASAFEMYRKRHGLLHPERVVDFLLLERKFPRSVLYCLTKARRSLSAITGTTPDSASGYEPERALGRLHAELEYAATNEILASGLHEWLDSLQVRLNLVGGAVAKAFFIPPQPEPDATTEQQQQ
jgi:uncharacterized alpha-E superfamily protein